MLLSLFLDTLVENQGGFIYFVATFSFMMEKAVRFLGLELESYYGSLPKG